MSGPCIECTPRESLAQASARIKGWAGTAPMGDDYENADTVLDQLRRDGYVVVPKQPSERMLDAALAAADACDAGWMDQIEDAVRAALRSDAQA